MKKESTALVPEIIKTSGTIEQVYRVELAETTNGFSLDVRLTAVTDGYLAV